MKEGISLVVVESPAKCRTIGKYLGNDYRVVATMGHIRDLPADELGVNVEKEFEPTYRVMPRKQKVVSQVRKEAGSAAVIFLATDEDREGEAIAWHVAQLLKRPAEEIKRVTFHEITPEAVRRAFNSPREIDLHLVNAQQARRVLDRLVGYTLSPLVGDLIKKGLSAGRVQSAALRILVEREKEITGFKSEQYYLVTAEVARADKPEAVFAIQLAGRDGKKISKPGIKDRGEAEQALAFLRANPLTVGQVTREERREFPDPPFTTSTLQQEAGRRLSLPASRTMSLAQQLYEGIELGDQGPVGLITYHRTDSLNLAQSARDEAARYIKAEFGNQYLPARPPVYRSRSSMAQEAHEAIRPTSTTRPPQSVAGYLSEGQLKLYTLVWNRFLASQMAPAVYELTRVRVDCGPYFLTTEGRVNRFDGHRRLAGFGQKDSVLPPLAEGDPLRLEKADLEEKATEPPPRYTEATLIKAMEKLGIGRPSTYAPIIETLVARLYVGREKRTLIPSPLGVMVNDLLVSHFPEVIDLRFTAQMEDRLDLIAEGKEAWRQVLAEFYKPFLASVQAAENNMASSEKCPKCGKRLIFRKSKKFGAFLGCEGYPDCDFTKNISVTSSEVCPKCGKPLILRESKKFGSFLGCEGYPACDFTRNLGQAGRWHSRSSKPEAPAGAEGEVPAAPAPAEVCPKCGKNLVLKKSKFGTFLGCEGYPACDFTRNLGKAGQRPAYRAKPSGSPGAGTVPCPKCKTGRLVERQSRYGKFLGCSNYPRCRYIEKSGAGGPQPDASSNGGKDGEGAVEQ